MYSDNPVQVSLEAVETLRREVAPYFAVHDTTLDMPEPGHFRFRGRPLGDLTEEYDEIRPLFEKYGFTPLLRKEQNTIALIGMPVIIETPPLQWKLNLGLFLATVITTLMTGAFSEPEYGDILNHAMETGTWGEAIIGLRTGLPYCLSILAILLAHEFGHYFAALYHRVSASLPYFIPLPPILSFFGTLGAVIIQREPSKNVRVQFDIGASGPLAGLIIAIPILIYGIATSPILPPPATGYISEGNSILYMLLKYLIHGQFLPTAEVDVSLNQYAWAGWTGLFITGLNLLPMGQLDGGRVAQVLFGRKTLEQLFWPVVISLILFSLLAMSPIWVLMIILFFYFGRHYEEPLDAVTELDPVRRSLAIFTMIMFILIFVPIPWEIVLAN